MTAEADPCIGTAVHARGLQISNGWRSMRMHSKTEVIRSAQPGGWEGDRTLSKNAALSTPFDLFPVLQATQPRHLRGRWLFDGL